MSAPGDLVCFLAKRIVEEPDAVRVEEVDADGDLLLRLHVAEADRGKGDRPARADGAGAAHARPGGGARSDRRVLLEIAE